jgi:hypothetical protein
MGGRSAWVGLCRTVVCCICSAAGADVLLTDDFADGDYSAQPAWTVESGSFRVEAGALACGLEANSAIRLDLGKTAWRTPVRVSLTLRHGGAAGNHLFTLALLDSASGKGYRLHASPNPGYFGTSGFSDAGTPGKAGAHLRTDAAPTRLEIAFDPEPNRVSLRCDGSDVFTMPNAQALGRVDRLVLSSGGGLAWLVDDVSVDAVAMSTAPVLPERLAVQRVYVGGVPHTEARGRRRTTYDPQQSFFQIGIWGNPTGEVWGTRYDLQVLRDAGFNTMWPWPSASLDQALEQGKAAGLQVVAMNPLPEALLSACKDHPNLLGNVWVDEPTGQFWGKDMEAKYAEFVAYKRRTNEIAPDLCVFVNDVPWISPPATEWWTRWNTAGDISCHDNYPVKHSAQTRSLAEIADTVGLAVRVNQEQKPVWLIVGAFEQPGTSAIPFRFPTPLQLRASVYAGLIHGATGIVYFTWDTYVCRDGNVIGMAPDPKVAYVPSPRQEGYTHPTPARPDQLVAARALWAMATQINRELAELTPALLAPTVDPQQVPYAISVTGLGRTEEPIHALLKPQPDGSLLLLTVNLEDAVLAATYTFPPALQSVERLYENQLPIALDKDARTFTDTYEPFETHVYRVQR